MNSLFEYASSLSNEIKWHGNHNKNAVNSNLKAGCISMIYEQGQLRYISVGDHELIRMIYPAVRDREWLTSEPVISGEEFDIRADSFRITYFCKYVSGEINFIARYKIEGNSDNSLIFSLEGEAMNTFKKNRIGFCVLHPVEEYAGKSCMIGHTNGESETFLFPRLIAPHPLFSEIKSMKWKTGDFNCKIDFYGDIFETEDQRNWTDASYKTYCTPLNRPFPVRVVKGEKIIQKIEFQADGNLKQETNKNDQILITVYAQKMLLIPMIGVGQSTRRESLTDGEIGILKNLRFDHYRADLYLFMSDWKIKGEVAIREAAGMKYPLELVLFIDDNFVNQFSDFIAWMAFANPIITILTIFHKIQQSTPDHLLNSIVTQLREALPGVKIGSGTNANFAQLNRNRSHSSLPDHISYSIHPQEHASDNTTLIENLQAQSYTVESAKQFSNDKGIWISPVNIQRRFNANIENYEEQGHELSCPPQVDNRLMSLFGACWTVGSLKYLCESDIKGVTYFETVGERGICQGDHPSRWPELFQSVKGMIFPVYFVFAYLLKYKSFKIIKSESSHPLKINSLILSDGENIRLILVNFTSCMQKAAIKNPGGEFIFKIKQLNADTYADAATDVHWLENAVQTIVNLNEPLLLNPFSVSFIDGCLNL